MKIIIPFKFNSSRLPRKNVKEFVDGKSLLDLTVENFKKHGHEIFLACEKGEETDYLINKYNVQHVCLSNTSNEWLKVVIELSDTLNKEFGPDEEFCLWQCVMPLFWMHNNIQDFIDFAEENISKCDSVVPVYEFIDYLVDENMQGVNFGPGSWHVPSQKLPKVYYITPMCVTTPKILHQYRYTYSPNSILWVAKGPHLDIDDEQDWKMAQILWKHWND
jgi:CMP-N-acetylneuraminic acid synthetase